jgi:hypothetical protein
MSWLFSQALVAAYSHHTFLDGEPCAQLSVMPTPHPFWRNDKTTDICRLSRSGVTYVVLTEDRGKELLTSFLEGFPVRTSVSPETVMDLTESDQGSGRNMPALLARYSQSSHTLKTAQCSLFEGSTESFATLPRSGSMRSGAVYQQANLAPITNAIASGFWPTPAATDFKGSPTLERVRERQAESQRGVRLPEQLARDGDVGPMNPDWEEWLMGWPIGWTALKPLETDRFHEWQQAHFYSLPTDLDVDAA